MRKLGNQYIQESLGIKEKKSINEIIAELTVLKSKKNNKKKNTVILTKKELSKKLGIAARTLNSYKQYFASLEDIKIKLNKNDRRPNKKIIDKIYKISKNYKIKQTRIGHKKYDKSEIDNLKIIITKKYYNTFKKEIEKDNWFGWLIRIHFSIIIKGATFTNDWLTYVTSIKDYKELNYFLVEQFYKKINSIPSLLGYEILEVVVNVTTKDYEPNKPKNKKRKNENTKKN